MMKRIIRENTLSTKQHYEFEGTDEQKTDEAWEVTCGYLGAKQKKTLEGMRSQMEQQSAWGQLDKVVTMSMLVTGMDGHYPYRALTEFFEGKRKFS
jgi:hypothetical protein